MNDILSEYSNDDVSCVFTYDDKNSAFHISNSYLVKSRYDRQKICEILSRTEKTEREYDNMYGLGITFAIHFILKGILLEMLILIISRIHVGMFEQELRHLKY